MDCERKYLEWHPENMQTPQGKALVHPEIELTNQCTKNR